MTSDRGLVWPGSAATIAVSAMKRCLFRKTEPGAVESGSKVRVSCASATSAVTGPSTLSSVVDGVGRNATGGCGGRFVELSRTRSTLATESRSSASGSSTPSDRPVRRQRHVALEQLRGDLVAHRDRRGGLAIQSLVGQRGDVGIGVRRGHDRGGGQRGAQRVEPLRGVGVGGLVLGLEPVLAGQSLRVVEESGVDEPGDVLGRRGGDAAQLGEPALAGQLRAQLVVDEVVVLGAMRLVDDGQRDGEPVARQFLRGRRRVRQVGALRRDDRHVERAT